MERFRGYVVALVAIAVGIALVGCMGVPSLSGPPPPARPATAPLSPAPLPIRTVVAPAAPRNALVVVYGDSLVAEALPYLNFLGSFGGSIDVHTWGGTATCDWFPDMFRTLPQKRPAVVVLAFSGNALTRCMETPSGAPLQGAAYLAAYRRNTEAAVAIATASGARVVIAASPRTKRAMANPHWDALFRVYRDIAAHRPRDVSYVDAGTLIAPRGRFTETMPCIPHELKVVNIDGSRPCQRDRIVVRAPDGVHFCPVGKAARRGVTDSCPLYSSGAFRYATALLDAAGR
jgi:hypothetical protein